MPISETHEAAEAGLYKSTDGSTYPRLQILTIQQILDGKQPLYPAHRRDATFKKAPPAAPLPPRLSPSPCSPPFNFPFHTHTHTPSHTHTHTHSHTHPAIPTPKLFPEDLQSSMGRCRTQKG